MQSMGITGRASVEQLKKPLGEPLITTTSFEKADPEDESLTQCFFVVFFLINFTQCDAKDTRISKASTKHVP